MIVIDLPWPPKELSPNARMFIGWRRHRWRAVSAGLRMDHGEALGGIHRCPRG